MIELIDDFENTYNQIFLKNLVSFPKTRMLGEISPPFWVIELFRPRFPPPLSPSDPSVRFDGRFYLHPKNCQKHLFFISPYLGRIRNPGIRKRKKLSLWVNLSLPLPPHPIFSYSSVVSPRHNSRPLSRLERGSGRQGNGA